MCHVPGPQGRAGRTAGPWAAKSTTSTEEMKPGEVLLHPRIEWILRQSEPIAVWLMMIGRRTYGNHHLVECGADKIPDNVQELGLAQAVRL